MRFSGLISAGLFAQLLLVSCAGGHLVGDSAERSEVERDFQQRRMELSSGFPNSVTAGADFSGESEEFDAAGLFSIFDGDLSREEREALEFLYAYMPLGDIADHRGEFFLENVRSSFRARKEMPWGRRIPEREFRHFVLPVRVNNEDLDSSRTVFYEELRQRVRGLSMYDAVLEVNHWCHEKVTYAPSDVRTTSPLATVRSAFGRCGEESVFTVAALRSVGIPARQVYTPRWAHTDDNHAWVEAWVDGQWCFFGACEPEPVLDLGWFNAPASRGMLMHTRVFGAYYGPEEVVFRTPRHTEINVTDNYAATASVDIVVVAPSGVPVEGASVEFKIYNYAEFYTVATRLTDASGRTSLSAGMGDMLVWVHKDGRFGYSKVSFGRDSKVTVVLQYDAADLGRPFLHDSASSSTSGVISDSDVHSGLASGTLFSEDIDIVPPLERANLPEVTPEQRAENDRRFALEDSLRNAYMATFMTEASAREWASSHGFRSDAPAAGPFAVISGAASGTDASASGAGRFESEADLVTRVLVGSKGNHREICEFLESLGTIEERDAGLDILRRISGKDLRDASSAVLYDHVVNTRLPAGFMARGVARPGRAQQIERFSSYVRNPRIANELLTAYKGFLLRDVPQKEQREFRSDPRKIAAWVASNIRVDSECNLNGAPISPAGVWKARVADPHSRDIFFVAMARTFGIPARIDEVTGKVQYFNERGAVDVDFDAYSVAQTGRLVARYTPVSHLSDPRYYAHFTISRLTAEGSLKLLSYDEGEVDMGGGASWSSFLRSGTTLDVGNYVLVTGTRLAGGGVLSNLSFFTIRPGRTTTVDLRMREAVDEVKVIGSFDSESKFLPLDAGSTSGEQRQTDTASTSGEQRQTDTASTSGEQRQTDTASDGLTSVLQTSGRGYFVVGMLGAGQEPTNHALRDLAAVAPQLEQSGRSIILLFPSEEQAAKFRSEDFPGLPSTVTFGIDIDGSIYRQLTSGTELSTPASQAAATTPTPSTAPATPASPTVPATSASPATPATSTSPAAFPIFIIGDTFNRVVFASSGYTIGLGEQLLGVIHCL